MAHRQHKFTGRHMAMVLTAGFGIVIAVNLVMASFAVGSFSGTVVDNSYVASQKFNGWLGQADQDRKLGWKVTAKRVVGGQIQITATGVPADAQVEAYLSRPLGEPATVNLTFAQESAGRWVSNEAVERARWDLRVVINAADAAGQPQGWADVVTLQ